MTFITKYGYGGQFVSHFLVYLSHFYKKNYRQTHKMDYILFASASVESIFWQKSYIMFCINNENRTWDYHQKCPPEGEIVAFNKMCHKNKIVHIKYMKFVANFEKPVLGS